MIATDKFLTKQTAVNMNNRDWNILTRDCTKLVMEQSDYTLLSMNVKATDQRMANRPGNSSAPMTKRVI